MINGSYRALDAWADGFRIIGGRAGPSHAHVQMVDFGKPVNVFGKPVAHDDVVHADLHGAEVVPAQSVRKLPAAVEPIARRERVILEVCRAPDFTVAGRRDAIRRSGEIHYQSPDTGSDREKSGQVAGWRGASKEARKKIDH